MSELENVDISELDNLRQKADAAHSIYSEAFHQRGECEKKLAACAARRAGLIAEYRRNERSRETALRECIENLIDDPTCDASSLTAAQTRGALLKLAVQKFSSFEAATEEGKVLEAKVAELAAQLQFEKLRAEVQESELLASLAPALELNGSIELQEFGGAAAAHRELIADLAAKLTGARQQLRAHADETQTTRDTYEKELKKWQTN